MSSPHLRLLLALVPTFYVMAPTGCQVERERARGVDYRHDIQGIFSARCAGCHGAERAEAGFVADAFVGVVGCLEGDVPVTMPSADGEVPLRAALARDDHRDLLTAAEHALVERWLAAGAPAGRGVHASDFVDPRSAGSHGAWLRAQRYRPLLDADDSMQCARCHAEAGSAAPARPAPGATACNTCHSEGVFACSTCHGNGTVAYPPRDACFFPTDRGGAHAAHAAPKVRAEPLACSTCHPTPAAPAEFLGTHADGVVEVWFDREQVPRGRFDASTGRCVDTCHARGGARPEPRWYDERPLGCNDCHGAPPPGHYAGSCDRCHAEADAAGSRLLGTRLHMNGVVDRGNGSNDCSACHGSPGSPWPASGAHRAHAMPNAAAAVACETCHVVPTGTDAHPRGGTAIVRFAGLAILASHRPTYDAATKSCAGTYCHEGRGGGAPTPRWDQPATGDCGGCHAVPPPAPHSASMACSSSTACHAGSTDAAGALTAPGAARHVDGHIDRGP